MAKNPAEATTITPQDLENKLKALQGDVQGKVDEKKSTILSVAAVAGVVVLMAVYLFGKRAGRKRSTVVEIRRV